MRRIFLLICTFVFIFQHFVFSQPPIDSLLHLYNSETKVDKKITLSGKLSIRYSDQRKTGIARKYADTLLLLSRKYKDVKGIVYARFCYARCDRYEGKYKDALNHLDVYNRYYQQKGDSSKLADGLFQSAVLCRLTGDYKKSLSFFYRVLGISQMEGNMKSIANTLHSIGIIYKYLKQYDQAIENYNKAYVLFDSLHDEKDVAMCLNSLGSVYSEKKEYALSKSYYEKSLELIKNTGINQRIGYAYSNLGNVCWEMGDYTQALAYHHKALLLREKLPEKEELAFTYKNLGATHMKLKNFKIASYYMLKSLDLAREIRANPLIEEVYSILADLSVERRDFQSAYTYHKLYSNLKDSIMSKETTFQILDLQAKYETSEKDKKITLLAKEKEVEQKEAERQSTLKKAFIGGLIFMILIALMLVYIYRQRLKSQKMLAEKNVVLKDVDFRRQMSELEMKSLRAQINPHFLFNCMNAINSMIIKGENEEASLYLSKFSKLVRLILENAETANVTLENELALLESYIQLEKLRFKGKINYHIEVEKNIDPEEAYIPSMILQPFVENSIWHGLLHKTGKEAGFLDIQVKEDEGQIICTIEDNGVGREKAREFHEKALYKSKSMGIKITEERLRLLSKKSSDELIKITDLKDPFNNALGTRVEINIPIPG